MKVLITGGAGFIGSHLAQHYQELGAEVTILDNCSTGSISNLDNFSFQGMKFTGDIRNVELVKE